jgi:hypothetical protein
VRLLALIVVTAAILVGCSACLGSAARAPNAEPTRFVVTYIPPIGNIMGSSSLYSPRHRLVRCGVRNRALCAAIAYYATHHPRTCSQNLFSTPAQFGVRGVLRGRRIAEAVAAVCRKSPPRLAAAEQVMFFALIRPQRAQGQRPGSDPFGGAVPDRGALVDPPKGV